MSPSTFIKNLIAPVALLALVAAAPAAATVTPDLLIGSGSGLSVPSGVAITSDGELWVADGEKGVCRVRTTATPRLVRDGVWCDPDGGPALDKTGQIAFDHQTGNLYVAEADSAAGGIWRLRWDAGSGTIAEGGKILDTPDDLVTGLAISYTGPPETVGGEPTAELNFTSKRTNSVRRVRDPESAQPTVETVGFRRFNGEEEVGSVAAIGNDLYLAEPFGVTHLTVTPGETPRAELVQGPSGTFPGGVPSALFADLENGRIYAGTENGNVRDQVDVYDPATGRQETYAIGVAGVLGLAVEDDGDLIVVDDPADGADADANDQARVWRAPLVPMGRPGARWTSVPRTFVRDAGVLFGYTVAPGYELPEVVTFECAVDAGPFEPCGGPIAGSRWLGGLTEGAHSFAVRPVHPNPSVGTGPLLRRTFVVDWTPPQVSVDNTYADRDVYTNDFTVRFSGGEPGLQYSCIVDGGPARECSPALYTFRGLTHGYHTVQVLATDGAGNVSPPSAANRFHFYVHAPSPPLPPVAPPPPAPPAAAPPVAKPAANVAKGAKRAKKKVARGEARLVARRPGGCRRGFTVWVKGASIDRVGFRVDGRRTAIVRKPDARGRFKLRVRRRAAGRHVLTALVRFDKGAGRAERLALEYRHCAPKALGGPR